jgi:hypothetical protein
MDDTDHSGYARNLSRTRIIQQQGPERACEEGWATLTESSVVELSVAPPSFIAATIRGTISL